MAGSNTNSVVYSGELGPAGASCDFPVTGAGCGRFLMADSRLSGAAADGLNGSWDGVEVCMSTSGDICGGLLGLSCKSCC